MKRAEHGQHRPTVLGEDDPYGSIVGGIGGALDEAVALCAVDELDRAVVAELELIGELARPRTPLIVSRSW